MKLPFGWRLILTRGPSLAPDYDVRRAILVLTKAIIDKTAALAEMTAAVAANTTAVNAAIVKTSPAPPVELDRVDPQAVADAALFKLAGLGTGEVVAAIAGTSLPTAKSDGGGG